jgi:hypothetical protein
LAFGAGVAMAQYPGKATKTGKPEPVLRSVAVVEWTGEPGKPSASRLVPVAVFDGEQLNDGTIYLNRPEPLALAGGTEYELQKDGKASGLFDVFGASEINGAWQGFGAWKPLTATEAAKAAGTFNTSSLYAPVDVPDDDHPVLKRKHPKGTDTDEPKPADTSSDASSTKPASTPSADDPDRPKLKRKSDDSSDTTANSGAGVGSGTASADSDPDRPKLKRKADDTSDTTAKSGTGSTTTANNDPDRPTIRRKRHTDDEGGSSNVAPDPDRPRLKHGKPADSVEETTHLVGYPPTLQQAVAVSDARKWDEHPWKYSWANPEDEAKMKSAMEALARTALGLDAPPAPAKPVRKTAAGKTAPAKKSMLAALPAEPVPLEDEQFRVFELTYGSSATMVLTASSPKPAETTTPDASGDKDPMGGPPVIKRGKPTTSSTPAPVAPKTQQASPAKPVPQKFVTLIAQPDLYGGVMVLLKSVTDSAHLDVTPRMKLIDAVDAQGDNRGELLFELRGPAQRQFGLYRVVRGSAEQLFATVAIP